MKKILIHYSLLFSVIVSRSRYKNWIKFPIKDGALTDNYFLLTENYFMTLKLKLYIDVHKRYRLIRLHIIYKRTSNPYLSHKTGFSGKNLTVLIMSPWRREPPAWKFLEFPGNTSGNPRRETQLEIPVDHRKKNTIIIVGNPNKWTYLNNNIWCSRIPRSK